MLLEITNTNQRCYWDQDYEQNWFETMWVKRNYHIYSEFWYRKFHMKPETFEFVDDSVFRHAIPIEKRVATSILSKRLSNGNSYRSVSKVFGIRKSTAVLLNQEFVSALLQHIQDFIRFPETEPETAIAIAKFHDSSGCELPQVVGAIDGTHIEILAPNSESRVDCFSRKRKYTINSQSVVGPNS